MFFKARILAYVLFLTFIFYCACACVYVCLPCLCGFLQVRRGHQILNLSLWKSSKNSTVEPFFQHQHIPVI